ncbi:Hypothetical protein I595_2174 [Croceitalea dokdonensis DOKDO 023]|uniref:WbqC-like family protein n=1 Tax=Croceitalea dokdonensis DOKDO 023 TaxID=1300341 RepID=A0A0P7ATC5_9FLAO|nr:WbqC family protein [Croceitalea dokdonensis]KPM31679.1 Hypothetical protein I595_2174 [Croceitalea dokdonensis DOKDO 023]
MKEVVLHPAYFPNIATMATMAGNEVIWEVHDNYQKQTYRNRCHICTDIGLHTLTIPIKHVGGQTGRQKYAEVRIDNSYRWKQQHWRTLQTAYRTSAFFEFYEDELEPLYKDNYEFLMAFNLATIGFLCNALGFPLPKKRTAAYQKNIANAMDARALIKAKNGIEFRNTAYFQVFDDRNGFTPNTSALDLLFNEGTNALNYLKNQESVLGNV